MKVVIFCGGLGVRMGEETQHIPKPMITVGSHPILWHIMKWYASWGHDEFILCLGHMGQRIKEYFLSYNEALANNFVLRGSEKEVQLLGRDIDDWRITFVDTGVQAEIGERLRAVRPFVADDPVFLATYGDALTDAPLENMVDRLVTSGKTGLLMSVRPRLAYHVLSPGEGGVVESVNEMTSADIWINGGFFVFRNEIFDVIEPGEDLVQQPFQRLIARGELLAYQYEGFWEPMDTVKDKRLLDRLAEAGNPPWERSLRDRPAGPHGA